MENRLTKAAREAAAMSPDERDRRIADLDRMLQARQAAGGAYRDSIAEIEAELARLRAP